MVSVSNDERTALGVVPIACGCAAALGGAIVAWHYHAVGLTLTHYDARGHLVVARRIIDSITPGWQQIGAVWLPLPHLLNALPVQLDVFYRTGASAVAMSIVAFAIATGAIASIVLTLTESAAAAIAAAAVFALNPNILYLQSTPMTEPLLLGLTTAAIAALVRSCHAGIRDSGFGIWRAFANKSPIPNPESRPNDSAQATTGSLFALACMTRYEAWPVTACALAAAGWARWRSGEAFRTAMRGVARIAAYPVVAIVAFTIFSRVVGGEWFVSRDFFVAENKSLHDPVMAGAEILWGLRHLSGELMVIVGAAGAAALAIVGLVDRRRSGALAAVTIVTTAMVPWLAFYKGHPFRIRYMVPLIAMEAIGAGFIAGLAKRTARPAVLLVLALVAYELRPLDASAPMVVEAQWDRPNVAARARVTACLGESGSGQKIMASMGSLGHYMQEASRSGFAIRDFLHEGNGDIWLAALENPAPFAEWILIEEKAEGGDMLARRARERPNFLNGYSRACEGAGLALYVRSGSSPRTDR
jgi:hypothetical protein